MREIDRESANLDPEKNARIEKYLKGTNIGPSDNPSDFEPSLGQVIKLGLNPRYWKSSNFTREVRALTQQILQRNIDALTVSPEETGIATRYIFYQQIISEKRESMNFSREMLHDFVSNPELSKRRRVRQGDGDLLVGGTSSYLQESEHLDMWQLYLKEFLQENANERCFQIFDTIEAHFKKMHRAEKK